MQTPRLSGAWGKMLHTQTPRLLDAWSKSKVLQTQTPRFFDAWSKVLQTQPPRLLMRGVGFFKCKLHDVVMRRNVAKTPTLLRYNHVIPLHVDHQVRLSRSSSLFTRVRNASGGHNVGLGSQIIQNLSPNVFYCFDCIESYNQEKLRGFPLAEIKCPGSGCTQILDPLVRRSFLAKKLFERWCHMLCESTLTQHQTAYRPYQNCSTLILNEREKNPSKSTYHLCKRQLCFDFCGKQTWRGILYMEHVEMTKKKIVWCSEQILHELL
ncbi:hypothetical protein IFM89_034201 [Coptis chinensis]|uniref:Uncharacterized protein n=1 Tax=Coptis chinensis TaxID=261450 RepID=A0A835LCH7_9MAGN|nr:hypothetical protein IFM89_034201 [Coptis chinensis]